MNTPTPLRLFCLALAVAVPTAVVQAQDTGRAAKMAGELQKRFTAADVNGDGKLTRDEAKDKMPMVYKHFDDIDTAHAGAVTMADIAAYAKTMRAERQAGK